jgi:hypothetical protein
VINRDGPPTVDQVRCAWRDLGRSDRTGVEVWCYGRALAGFSSEEIAAQLNHGLRWRPSRASRWSADLVRQRIRYARRALRRALRMPDPRSYANCAMPPERAREHRRMYRALRSESARLDGMVLDAGLVR